MLVLVLAIPSKRTPAPSFKGRESVMKAMHGLAVVIIGYVSVAFIAMTGEARASLVYNWTGECGYGCMGLATAKLVLKDIYTPGTPLNDTDFMSFEYSSSSGYFKVPGNMVFENALGTLPQFVGQSQPYVELNFSENGAKHRFYAGSDVWGIDLILPPDFVYPEDGGLEYVWRRELPEPGSLGTVGLGLAALGFVGWRHSHRRQAP
jgi:hypothetical protein